jgi:hypothetical protein
MGQQQLLLIVLGVIVVGIAVVAGMSLFSASRESACKDELVSHNTAIAANAQQYFAKPTSMGGGNLSFTGFPTLALLKLNTTTNGTYTIDVSAKTTGTITATPINAGYTWTAITTVYSDSIRTLVTPNP